MLKLRHHLCATLAQGVYPIGQGRLPVQGVIITQPAFNRQTLKFSMEVNELNDAGNSPESLAQSVIPDSCKRRLLCAGQVKILQ